MTAAETRHGSAEALNHGQRHELDALLASHFDELVAFRRQLHAHPELSGREFATTESIISRLQVSGLLARTLRSGTGCVADVPGVRPGPIVALRADIDALAMDEALDGSYRSRIAGAAHCCGHDVHTTIVLAAGLILARLLRRRDAPPGSARLIFEPSEESVPGGAVEIVRSGYLNGVAAIYGLHCDPKLETGRIGVTAGAITSAADVLEVHLTGPGGHTARPDQTVDLVKVAARIAVEAPLAMEAQSSHPDAVRLVFGSLRAGHAPNVVPSSAHLFGTLRAKDRADWNAAPDLFAAAVREIVEPTGAAWNISYERGVPPVVNDPQATALLASIAAQLLGADNVVEAGQSWGGDSFAWYLEKAPGTYARLGVHDPSSDGPRRDLHSSNFTVDENAIGVGVRLLVATAMATLRAEAR